MGSSENFCLRWNDFESNVSGAFRDLRAEQDFFDVTLGCSDGDGRSLQAHKVILSACSNVFKQMLRQQAAAQPLQAPFIFLRGVSYCDLSAVLDFMYHGEVNVAQDDLNSFLAVAEDLQVKGLTNKDGETSKKTVRKSSEAGPASKRPRISPRPSNNSSATIASSSAVVDTADVNTVVDIKSDPEAGPSAGAAVVTGDDDFGEGYADDYGDGSFLDEADMTGETTGADTSEATGGKGHDSHIPMDRKHVFVQGQLALPKLVHHSELPDKLLKIGKTSWRCGLCDYNASYITHMKEHLMVKHLVWNKRKCSICNERVVGSKQKHYRAFHSDIFKKEWNVDPISADQVCVAIAEPATLWL